jgi:hypothetical protein
LGLILCLCLITGLADRFQIQTDSLSQSNKWAIIIGIGNYKYLDVDTRYANKDALAISKQLEYFFGYDHIKTLVDSDATEENIKMAIAEWLNPKEKKNDTVLLFFAGHGNSAFLEMYDSLKNSNCNDIGYQDLNTWLDDLDTNNITILLDSCESGNYGTKISGTNRVILTGGMGNEKCWQEKKYEHGIFTYYILNSFDHLNNVDIDNDGEVSIEEIYTFVKKDIAIEFQNYPPPSPQHPNIIDNHKGEIEIINLSH